MLKLPEVDLSRFHIESITQKLEGNFFTDSFSSVIQVRVKMVDDGNVESLWSRKHIYLEGHQHGPEDERNAFIKREAKAHLMWFLDHEVKECLYFDGERYEDPHPEQTFYERAVKAEEEARKRRREALEKHEREIAQAVTERLRGRGKPQGKSQFFFFDELMATIKEKTDFQKAIDAACSDQKTQLMQETSTDLRYLAEPQTSTLDMMIQEKIQSHPLTTIMAAACGLRMTEPGKVLTSVTQEDYQRAAKNYARETR